LVTYRYFLITITIFALYQMFFSYLIRPYYFRILSAKNTAIDVIPEVSFEVVYLLIIILGLALAPQVGITPYLLWGIILIVYGLAVKNSRHSFFLASALLFKMHRELSIEKQLNYQTNIIFISCLGSGFIFIILALSL